MKHKFNTQDIFKEKIFKYKKVPFSLHQLGIDYFGITKSEKLVIRKDDKYYTFEFSKDELDLFNKIENTSQFSKFFKGYINGMEDDLKYELNFIALNGIKEDLQNKSKIRKYRYGN